MNWILNLLRNPSAFHGDPNGYLRNQLGHAYIVGGGLAVLGVPFWLIVLGYGLWEGAQLKFFGSTLDDSLEDIGHVSLVACAFGLMVPQLLLVHAFFIVSGYYWRRSGG